MDDLTCSKVLDDYSHSSVDLIYTAVNVPGIGACTADFECQLIGCKCAESVCNDASCTCVSRCGRNYSEDGLLIADKLVDACVIECNDSCLCVSSCKNRLVQRGPRRFLEIFECESKGLGLRTQRAVRKGDFICEYAGEVIGMAEAKKRFEAAFRKGGMNYIFVLRENTWTGVVETIVDPTVVGNIGRYINHSCDPNCAIVPVRTDCAVPKLAIFAIRDIAAGEEIAFDYAGSSSERKSENFSGRKECRCGADNCLKFLPFDTSLL